MVERTESCLLNGKSMGEEEMSESCIDGMYR